MEKINLKEVSAETRKYIKTQTIFLREQGRKNRDIAEILNIQAKTVANIIYYYKLKGEAFLQEKIRGRKAGEKRTLSAEQEKMIYEIINMSSPEQNGIASCLWGCPSIQQLIKQKLGITMPLRTISGYMKRWGMSYKRPTRKNYKQNPKKVEEFKTTTYAEIVQKAKDENADIIFVDETGINNQEYRVRGYSPKGVPPVVSSVSRRESINMISGITSGGICRYQIYDTSMTQQRYKHRLLLLLDEFPALGKLGIFEQAIAYFGGWNIKAYLICQDKAQLDAAYGKDESITSNCHITVAYAPNKVETAKYLSDRLGVTTVIKEQESISFQGGTGIFAKKSVTKSQQEVQRAVLTPDEIMRLPGPVKDVNQNITEPGDMLIFSAGFPPIYGKQILYFLDKIFSERSKIDAPEKSDVIYEKAA